MGMNGKHMMSTPSMGAKGKSDMPANSGHMAQMGSKGMKHSVKDAAHNPAALKKARMFNERSENGGANPSAHPCA